jgi:hypothetical protein
MNNLSFIFSSVLLSFCDELMKYELFFHLKYLDEIGFIQQLKEFSSFSFLFLFSLPFIFLSSYF